MTGPKEQKALTERLLSWYGHHHRSLPWRQTRDPYAIWVAEIMLQQTQVNTVIPYYERFMARFPTVQDLAQADLDDVLKLWEGLGYYARARNLHLAARRIVAEHGGQVPDTWDALIALPGIGDYTAGAILSIAFGKPVPALDGNARRVLCRLFNVADDVSKSATRRRLWKLAEDLVPGETPGAFNQAMMDLGATLCLPKNPLCAACPLDANCEARPLGLQNERPVRARRKPLPHYQIGVAVIWKEDHVLIARRPLDGLLGGLWEFPGGKQEPGETLEACVAREVQEELGIQIEVGDRLMTINHAYTHFKVTLHVFNCQHHQGQPQALGCEDWRWVSVEELDDYAFPAANRRITAALRTMVRETKRCKLYLDRKTHLGYHYHMTDPSFDIFPNGRDAETGDLVVDPLSEDELAEGIPDLGPGRPTRRVSGPAVLTEPDWRDPFEVGWAAIVHQDEDPEVVASLDPLVRHRRGLLLRYQGQSPAELADELTRVGGDDPFWGPKLPHYVLIVGGPEAIPFDVQYYLDSQRAVGRLHLDDAAAYRNYVAGLIASEGAEPTAEAPRTLFVAVEEEQERVPVTRQAWEYLSRPLSDTVAGRGYVTQVLHGGEPERAATRQNLLRALSPEAPGHPLSLIFTTSHGLGVPTDAYRSVLQGSLVLQGWPGRCEGPDDTAGLFTGRDIGEGVNVAGLIFFSFACYSAGTPSTSSFGDLVPPPVRDRLRKYQANQDFVAYLPRCLLGTPQPALAFIGHVDPAWQHGFSDQTTRQQRAYPFMVATLLILAGMPVGYAMAQFNERCQVLSQRLLDGADAEDKRTRTHVWITRNDARNYIILGDPAARLQV